MSIQELEHLLDNKGAYTDISQACNYIAQHGFPADAALDDVVAYRPYDSCYVLQCSGSTHPTRRYQERDPRAGSGGRAVVMHTKKTPGGN